MRLFIKLSLLFFFLTTTMLSQDLGEDYILEWKNFYPSKALKSGTRTSVFQYEDFSNEKVITWLDFNNQILQKLKLENAGIDPIDSRLLRVQAQSEVDKWKTLSEQTDPN